MRALNVLVQGKHSEQCTDHSKPVRAYQPVVEAVVLLILSQIICKIDLLCSLIAAAKATISWPEVKRGARKPHCLSLNSNQNPKNTKRLVEQLQRNKST